MLCQYLNKYKNNWSEIAIKLNAVSLQFTLLEGSGEEIIFSKIYFTPTCLARGISLRNSLCWGPALNYDSLSIFELLT